MLVEPLNWCRIPSINSCSEHFIIVSSPQMGWRPSINKSVRNRETGYLNRNPSAANVGAGRERKEELTPPGNLTIRHQKCWLRTCVSLHIWLILSIFLCFILGVYLSWAYSTYQLLKRQLCNTVVSCKGKKESQCDAGYLSTKYDSDLDSCCAWVALLGNYCAYKSLPLRWSPSLWNKRSWTTTINKDCLDS